jgi:hypothetical protein
MARSTFFQEEPALVSENYLAGEAQAKAQTVPTRGRELPYTVEAIKNSRLISWWNPWTRVANGQFYLLCDR